MLRLSLLLLMTSMMANAEPPQSFRVAGYLPDYRAASYDLPSAIGLSDLILFSAEPDEEGHLDLRRLKDVPWVKLRQFKTRERIRLILCVGGWDRSKHFATTATTLKKRRTFVQSAVKICLEERLDGLDLDWEHPKNAEEQAGYSQLLTDLRDAFQPHGLCLSVTMAGWQRLTPKAYAAADWIQVMAYDHDGRHSTFDRAKEDVLAVIESGASPKKIVLGLPLYGRDIKQRNIARSYREIVAQHNPPPEQDQVAGIYFNGPTTLSRKVRLARESSWGGIMVWELGQDAPSPKSLLQAILQTLRDQK